MATAATMGIERRNSSSFRANSAGYRSGSRSISEKMRAKRRIHAGTASADDHKIDQLDLNESYRKHDKGFSE